MGYRTYLGQMEKNICEELRSTDQISATDFYDLTCTIHKYTSQLHEFGKSDFFSRKNFAPFFENAEVQKKLTIDEEFYILSKEDLMCIIERQQKHVTEVYAEMKKKSEKIFNTDTLSDDLKTDIAIIYSHFSTMENWWANMPVDTNPDTPVLCSSWLYEHTIFDLIRIYKTFDFDNYKLIFYGY